MIDILLCIASSASLIIIFKLMDRFKLQFLPVIAINYGVAVVCGMLISGKVPQVNELVHSIWIWHALFLGIMFITIFLVTAKSTVLNGITVTAIAQKMSLIIPLTAAFILYDDRITVLKVVGIAMALSAIVLTTRKSTQQSDERTSGTNGVLLPLLVFLGAGVIDSTINFVQKRLLVDVPFGDFLMLLFGTAFIVGIALVLFEMLMGKYKPSYRELLGGILLGVPNYFSMHFLLRSLQTSGLQSSVLYPILNISVVATAALIAAFAFKEKLSAINVAGILLAISAILVLMFT